MANELLTAIPSTTRPTHRAFRTGQRGCGDRRSAGTGQARCDPPRDAATDAYLPSLPKNLTGGTP